MRLLTHLAGAFGLLMISGAAHALEPDDIDGEWQDIASGEVYRIDASADGSLVQFGTIRDGAPDQEENTDAGTDFLEVERRNQLPAKPWTGRIYEGRFPRNRRSNGIEVYWTPRRLSDIPSRDGTGKAIPQDVREKTLDEEILTLPLQLRFSRGNPGNAECVPDEQRLELRATFFSRPLRVITKGTDRRLDMGEERAYKTITLKRVATTRLTFVSREIKGQHKAISSRKRISELAPGVQFHIQADFTKSPGPRPVARLTGLRGGTKEIPLRWQAGGRGLYRSYRSAPLYIAPRLDRGGRQHRDRNAGGLDLSAFGWLHGDWEVAYRDKLLGKTVAGEAAVSSEGLVVTYRHPWTKKKYRLTGKKIDKVGRSADKVRISFDGFSPPSGVWGRSVDLYEGAKPLEMQAPGRLCATIQDGAAEIAVDKSASPLMLVVSKPTSRSAGQNRIERSNAIWLYEGPSEQIPYRRSGVHQAAKNRTFGREVWSRKVRETDVDRVHLVVHSPRGFETFDSLKSLANDQKFKVSVVAPRKRAGQLGKTINVDLRLQRSGKKTTIELSSHNSPLPRAGPLTYSHPDPLQMNMVFGRLVVPSIKVDEKGDLSVGTSQRGKLVGHLKIDQTELRPEIAHFGFANLSKSLRLYRSDDQRQLGLMRETFRALARMFYRIAKDKTLPRALREAAFKKGRAAATASRLLDETNSKWTRQQKRAVAERYLRLLKSDPKTWGLGSRGTFGFYQTAAEKDAVRRGIKAAKERIDKSKIDFAQTLSVGTVELLNGLTGADAALKLLTGKDARGKDVKGWERFLSGVELASGTVFNAVGLAAAAKGLARTKGVKVAGKSDVNPAKFDAGVNLFEKKLLDEINGIDSSATKATPARPTDPKSSPVTVSEPPKPKVAENATQPKHKNQPRQPDVGDPPRRPQKTEEPPKPKVAENTTQPIIKDEPRRTGVRDPPNRLKGTEEPPKPKVAENSQKPKVKDEPRRTNDGTPPERPKGAEEPPKPKVAENSQKPKVKDGPRRTNDGTPPERPKGAEEPPKPKVAENSQKPRARGEPRRTKDGTRPERPKRTQEPPKPKVAENAKQPRIKNEPRRTGVGDPPRRTKKGEAPPKPDGRSDPSQPRLAKDQKPNPRSEPELSSPVPDRRQGPRPATGSELPGTHSFLPPSQRPRGPNQNAELPSTGPKPTPAPKPAIGSELAGTHGFPPPSQLPRRPNQNAELPSTVPDRTPAPRPTTRTELPRTQDFTPPSRQPRPPNQNADLPSTVPEPAPRPTDGTGLPGTQNFPSPSQRPRQPNQNAELPPTAKEPGPEAAKTAPHPGPEPLPEPSAPAKQPDRPTPLPKYDDPTPKHMEAVGTSPFADNLLARSPLTGEPVAAVRHGKLQTHPSVTKALEKKAKPAWPDRTLFNEGDFVGLPDGTPVRIGPHVASGAMTDVYRSIDNPNEVVRFTALDGPFGEGAAVTDFIGRKLLEKAESPDGYFRTVKRSLEPTIVRDRRGRRYVMTREENIASEVGGKTVTNARERFANRPPNEMELLTETLAIRELNRKGIAWTDHKRANFDIVPDQSSPTGYKMLMFDTGGFAPMKGATAAHRYQNARRVQQVAANVAGRMTIYKKGKVHALMDQRPWGLPADNWPPPVFQTLGANNGRIKYLDFDRMSPDAFEAKLAARSRELNLNLGKSLPVRPE